MHLIDGQTNMEDQFRPAVWARSPHLQTIFGSLKLRVWGKNEMADASQEMIVDAGNGAVFWAITPGNSDDRRKV